MDLISHDCPCCGNQDIQAHTTYETKNHGSRQIYHCRSCGNYFSETYLTPMAGLKTPLSRIIEILKMRTSGMSLNACARNYNVSKKSIIDWEWRLAGIKPTLLLYSLMHQFIEQVVEGDELYTKVHHNTIASDSEGWTIVLMERSSRFLWELQCGKKDEKLFKSALELLVQVIEQTRNLTLLSDGERRYGNLLFAICHEVLGTGKPGRPKKRLRKGVRVRLKNKGSKKRARKPRPKYQAPVLEHPETTHSVKESDIHANHVEAFNSSLRRNNSAFRRRTNTYGKTVQDLQRTIDLQWIIHNFVRVHYTTKFVPAVKLGILEIGLKWEDLFKVRYAF
jgi:transposase-like protein